MVNPYTIMPYHAIKPQFWRDFYHFIPISGDYLAVFLQHLPHQQGGSSHGGPGGVTLPWVHCNEVGFLADHHPIRQENAIRMCLKMEFWLVVLSHLPIWKILEWVRQLGWCSIPNWMEQNSSKAPGCMMISGYLWHFGEHWSNRSIPKNSRIFPWIRIPWEFMGIHGNSWEFMGYHMAILMFTRGTMGFDTLPYQRIKFIPRIIATTRHLWSSSCPVDSRSFIDLNADSSPRKTFHSTTS